MGDRRSSLILPVCNHMEDLSDISTEVVKFKLGEGAPCMSVCVLGVEQVCIHLADFFLNHQKNINCA